MENKLQKYINKGLEKIRKFYDNDCLDIIKNNIVLSNDLKTGEYTVTGTYSWRTQMIKINKKWFDACDERGEETDIIRTITHEIGHYIHYQVLKADRFRFPTEGKTWYAGRNYKENFAEAFADMTIEREGTEKRTKRMLDILSDSNLIVAKEKAEKEAKKSASPKRTRSKKNTISIVRIFDPQGNIAYEFNSYEEAVKELKIYSLRDLKYICRRNHIGDYGQRSKYKAFNGFKFTVEEKEVI